MPVLLMPDGVGATLYAREILMELLMQAVDPGPTKAILSEHYDS